MTQKQAINTLEEALALHRSLRHDEAEQLYASVRQAAPKNFDGWFLSGAMAFQRGNHLDKAIALLSHARKLQPASIECRLFLGMALADAGRHAEAEPLLASALKKAPDRAAAWENLAKCQRALGHSLEAIESLKKMTALQPENPDAHEMLGELVALAQGFPTAEPHFRKAVALNPGLAIAWSNLGLSLLEQPRRIADGMECLDKALQLDPFLTPASAARALGLLRLYRPEESLDLHNSILWMEPQNARVISARNMILNYLPGQTRQSVLEAHEEFGVLFSDEFPHVFFNPPEPEKKLRVGIVSPDLRHHSVAFFLAPILKNLDPAQVQTILYHGHHCEDATSAAFRDLASKWTNLVGIEDEAAAGIIRKDAPDILIDLAGHSSMNRLSLFSRRLAPVQISYLGYPNTTGLSAITHRLVDETTDPHGEADPFATEKLIRFSPCAWAYEPPANAPLPRMPEPGAPITFASFNNFLKVTNEVLETWAQILAQVPGSRLLLKSPYFEDSETQASVMERIIAAGLPETRVELLGFLPSTEEHLATYSRVDVALDTFPYNGTTTTCEALWMGVPVVSIAGDRHASRVGLSILSAIGHQEWAPPDRDTHIQTAVNLATNESLRRELRTSLRQKMAASLLLDHATQSRNFESALRQAWQEWCSELKPAPLPQ